MCAKVKWRNVNESNEKDFLKQYIKEWKAKKEETVKVYGEIYYENYLEILEEWVEGW